MKRGCILFLQTFLGTAAFYLGLSDSLRAVKSSLALKIQKKSQSHQFNGSLGTEGMSHGACKKISPVQL